ncbi:uncharacterized protein M421DRAFT_423652 [Didymella exigua CBS 183.55]|uniref:Uncharacterized protein n=1 Tax=Didymella exigua CBS 183.55 TaxID=1150837 RepID=A0A6A5RDT8_9PLEO|nr:uncharacterized protein M421DRAFT_423652 [Didymella exigua CBS 183.55]KAF1925559.1 hypothetical protein M421DRAFT_423652 [Didymella exigua CBS 183.55]
MKRVWATVASNTIILGADGCQTVACFAKRRHGKVMECASPSTVPSDLFHGNMHSITCLMLSTSASLVNSSVHVSAVAKYREVHRRLPSDLISRAPRSLSSHTK